jgi:tripartite-type tricarboxylate transporter receptor subunit TctC
VAVAPLVLVAHPSLAPRTLREFIDHAARQPGGIAFAAGGPGTASHVAQALLERMTGIKVLTVQYKGGGQAIVALVAAEASAGFSTIPVALPHVRSGRLRAYAIASPERFAGAPEVPTFAEAGLPGFEAGLWIGMLAPAKTPAGVVAKLNRDIVQILREPTMQVALLAQGAQPAPGTPAEFAQLIKSELQKMKELVEATGLRAD